MNNNTPTKKKIRGELSPDLELPDQETKRLELAQRFLDEVLLPRIEEDTLTHPQEIEELYHHFQQEHTGSGSDFELIHVLGIAWQRTLVNDCLAETAPEKLPLDAVEVEIAHALLGETVFGQGHEHYEEDHH